MRPSGPNVVGYPRVPNVVGYPRVLNIVGYPQVLNGSLRKVEFLTRQST